MFAKSLLFATTALVSFNAFASPSAEDIYEQNRAKIEAKAAEQQRQETAIAMHLLVHEFDSAVAAVLQNKLEAPLGHMHLDQPTSVDESSRDPDKLKLSVAIFSNDKYVCHAHPHIHLGFNVHDKLDHYGNVFVDCEDIHSTRRITQFEIPMMAVTETGSSKLGSFMIGGEDTDAEVYTPNWENGRIKSYSHTIVRSLPERIGDSVRSAVNSVKRAL